MTGHALRTIAVTELLLRLRRLSTMLVLLAVAAICWQAIGDPAQGQTLISVAEHQVRNTSQTLATGSANMGTLLFGLAAFYLVRGRSAIDLRSGMGAVIGASGAGNGLLTVGRWLGALAYMGVLALAYLGTTLVLHGLRGSGPIQPLIYLQTYVLLLLPIILLGVSCAVLFDHVGWLMGKGGDVLYFLLWCAQFSCIALMSEGRMPPWALVFDFSGLALTLQTLTQHFDTRHLSLGASTFDPALAPLTLPETLWTASIWGMRSLSALLALLPLLPAALWFHRYSPDRVKVGAGSRRSPLGVLNAWLQPAGRLATPLAGWAMRLPGLAGEVLAEVALTLRTMPALVVALIAVSLAALLAGRAALGGVLLVGIVAWGIAISGIASRDAESGSDAMTAALRGGVMRRYQRQWLAALVLALPFAALVGLRWFDGEPVRAAALAAGVLALVSAAVALGCICGTARVFLSLFMLVVFVAVQAPTIGAFDLVGFNGSANPGTAGAYAGSALLLYGAGWLALRRRA
jgi:hypothetical protein